MPTYQHRSNTTRSPFNVFAISMDLGTITATTDPVVWAVGMVRDPAVQAVTASGGQEIRSPYWRTSGTAQNMVRFSAALIVVSP